MKEPFRTKPFLLSLYRHDRGKSLTSTEEIKIKPAMDKANYVPHCLGMGNLICSWQWFDGLSHPFSDPAFGVIFIVNQSLQCRTLSTISVTMTNSHISVSVAARIFPLILHCLAHSGRCWTWYTMALSSVPALGRIANGLCEGDGAKHNGTNTGGRISNLCTVILAGMLNLILQFRIYMEHIKMGLEQWIFSPPSSSSLVLLLYVVYSS